MDPDACLALIRDSIAAYNAPYDPQLDSRQRDWRDANIAADLAEHAQALDDWLRHGGFLPAAWARGEA